MSNEEKIPEQKELTKKLFDDTTFVRVPVKILLTMGDEEFKLVAKAIMRDGLIKFVRSPVFDLTFFNINIIEKLNTPQLNFVQSLLLNEYSKRKLPKEEILEKLKEFQGE